MSERIPVYVRGLDPVSESGVSALLRPRPEIELRATPDRRVSVAVAVVDVVDNAILRMVRELRTTGADHILLIVSSIDDTELVAAVGAGIRGVVLRADATPERLAGAIANAHAKGGVLSPHLVGKLMGQVYRLQNQVLGPRGIQISGLSQRESDVLRMIAHGLELSEIAEKLSYSERTIKNTLHDVLTRFQMKNRTQAIAFAIREGLI